MFRFRFAAIAAAAMVFTASAFADYAVGTCQPNLTSYSTISQAVSSVPSGSLIFVCPGNYPEQVTITKPLTLEGVPGSSGAAVIVVPPGGLTQAVEFDDLVGEINYQVLVQSTGPVNLLNLGVDGTGGYGPNVVAGIVYMDSSGTANHLAVRNQQELGQGAGLLALTVAPAAQTVTVENSVFRGFDNLGVWAMSSGGTVTANVYSNTINGIDSAITIGVGYTGASGIAQSNQITGTANPFVVVDSSHVVVTGNTVSGVNPFPEFGSTPFSIDASSATITSNTIDASGIPAFTVGGPSTTAIQHNTITNSSIAVLGCGDLFFEGPPTGYTISLNTITDASVGLSMPPGNTTAPNTYYVTANTVDNCSSASVAGRKMPRRLRALLRRR